MVQSSIKSISSSAVAPSALVPLFAPYCKEHDLARLEQGLARLQSGELKGSRPLLGGECRAFSLVWEGGLAPLEQLSCQLRFAQLPQVDYNVELPAHRLLAWLLELSDQHGDLDLPDAFWSWLILGVEPVAAP